MLPHVPPFQPAGEPHSSPVPMPLPTSLMTAWLLKMPQPRPIPTVPKAPLTSTSSTRTSLCRFWPPFVVPNPSLLAAVMFAAYWKLPETVIPSNSDALKSALNLLGFHPDVAPPPPLPRQGPTPAQATCPRPGQASSGTHV